MAKVDISNITKQILPNKKKFLCCGNSNQIGMISKILPLESSLNITLNDLFIIALEVEGEIKMMEVQANMGCFDFSFDVW